MIRGFRHIVQEGPSLREFRDLLDAPDAAAEAMLRRYGTASGGEGVMISAALSLVPPGRLKDWLADDAQKVPPFRLDEVGRLDRRNLRALLEAVAMEAGYLDEVGRDRIE